jgi:hypothetical protein
LNKFLSITLAMLMVMLPIATANMFTGWAVEGSAPMGTLDIEASLPAFSRSGTITIEGRTKPAASVQVFVNEVRTRVGPAGSDGKFKFTSIGLTQGENTVKLQAFEGNTGGTAKEFKVLYDSIPPSVKLATELPAATRESSITVSGDVNEKVTIKYRVVQKTDTTPPDILAGLKANKIAENSIELVWEPSTATDLKEYLVKRNGRRIATSSLPSYNDINLQSGVTYSYGIAPVDTSCNIGTSADLAVATTKGGKNVSSAAPPEINMSCETPYQTTTAGSPFSITLPLAQGLNDVELIFEDAAGNQEIIKQTVKMDNAGPKFLETNLDKLSPSYIPDITIKGKLDEQATVFVYINDEAKPAEYEVTEADGSFSIKTALRATIRIKRGATRTSIEAGEGWANKIRLEAVDLAGNKASFGPTDVDFLLCGSGTYWEANVGEAMPSILLPRLMIQGVQQIGIPFTLNYIGREPTTAPPIVTVRPILLAPGAEKEFDHNWVQVSNYAGKKTTKNYTGYVQIQFENVDPLPETPDAGPNEKERALSKHRIGECLVPGVGCAKIFLQMEITFQQSIVIAPTDPSRPIVTPKIEKRVQKVCMPVEVAIDMTIPTDIIPKGLLKTAVKLIGRVISYIDKVLKPLTTISEYVLYGCLASTVWMYFQFFTEQMACEGSQALSVVTGGSWSKAVADAGICKEFYSGNNDQDKQKKCYACQSKMESRKKFEMDVMHGLCDRIGCPSAPTLTYYIKQQIGKAEPLEIEPSLITSNPELAKWQVGGAGGTQGGGLIYSGNDCAFTAPDFNFITPTYSGGTATATILTPQIPPGVNAAEAETLRQSGRVSYNRMGIQEIYTIAKGKDAPKTFPNGPKPDDCKKMLHPAHPNCCGIQYQKDWSSACGPGTAMGGSLDTFDELKQSTCLSAQQANADTKDLGCNVLWNSVAGFCENNAGEPTPQVVRLEANWEGPKPARPGADNNDVFLFAIPSGLAPTSPTGAAGKQYKVYSGYAAKTPQFEKMTVTEAGVNKDQQLRLSQGLTAVLETDVSNCFGQTAATGTSKTKTPEKSTEDAGVECLATALCSGKTRSGYSIYPCQKDGNIRAAYNSVNEIVGVSEQQYIVRPTSGLLRSIECVCLPAIVGYLQMWRSVLGAFYGCFQRILLTGEGSEGFCAAKLSGTICDLLFEAISCITQKFNSPGVGGRVDAGGGFGNVLGSLTGAGTAVSRSVTERYGSAGPFQSLFSERKLVHAICIWAFTGTWDLNMQGLFQQQVQELPLDTEGALTTCERTFISYDPTTSPPGMTTFAYRIAGGLIAGADVRYRLTLKCSAGFSCDPRTNPDGKCDCQSKTQELPVSTPELGNGMAKKYDLVNFDSPFVVSPQTAYESAGYRYDTAVLSWDWTDSTTRQSRTGQVDCSIRETLGGQAPAFCALDAFSGKFRCMFGEQENGIRIRTANPVYPEKQDVFALKDPLKFSLELQQAYPEDRRSQNIGKKFLTYQIKDAAGNVVDGLLTDERQMPLQTSNEDTSQKYTLSTNGVFRFTVPNGETDFSPLAKFKVNEDTIKRHSATGPSRTGIQQRTWGVDTLKSYVTTINLMEGGALSQGTYKFLINFPNYGANPAESNYEIWQINPAATNPEPNARDGWLSFKVGSTPIYSGKQTTGQLKNTAPFTFKSGRNDVSGVIEFDRMVFQVQALQVLVTYAPPKAASAATPACPKDPITWTALFTIYDADRQGNPTNQVSTDPENGKQQQIDVNFKVQCANADQVKKERTCAELNGECKEKQSDCKEGTVTGSSDCPSTCCKKPVVISAKDTTLLPSLAYFLDTQVKAVDRYYAGLTEISASEAADRTKLPARISGYIIQMDALKTGNDAAIAEFSRQIGMLSEPANKAMFTDAQAAMQAVSNYVGGAKQTMIDMNKSSSFDVDVANEKIQTVKTNLADAKSMYTATIEHVNSIAQTMSAAEEAKTVATSICTEVQTAASASKEVSIPEYMYLQFKDAGYDSAEKIKTFCKLPSDVALTVHGETTTTTAQSASTSGGTTAATLPQITYETAPAPITVKSKPEGQVVYVKLADQWNFLPNIGDNPITFEPGTQIKFNKVTGTTETSSGFWMPQAYAEPGQTTLIPLSASMGVSDDNMISKFLNAQWAFV